MFGDQNGLVQLGGWPLEISHLEELYHHCSFRDVSSNSSLLSSLRTALVEVCVALLEPPNIIVAQM